MKKEKVLYVDDEHINLLILKKILGKNYDVTIAKSGHEALDKLEKDPEIKLVISDMKMPEMNGLQFIKLSTERFQNKKYFMLSGFAITEEIQNAIDSNLICNYFQKPANFEEIDNALKKECEQLGD